MSVSPRPHLADLAPVLMIQGTSSSVGKSVLVAGLCRILARRGYRVAPFKAQNMSLNAAVTADGGEIARSTFVQARAAGIEPTVDMNPILLKPEPGLRSQVVVRGKVRTNQPARDYFRGTLDLWPIVAESLDRLRRGYDVVVAEGAGGPAELNLRDRDVANMRVARHAQASVVLVGDIERGGVFAQLLGTLDLLPPEEQALVRGLVVNRFRGDRALFADGVRILEERSGRPVFGVVPWVGDLGLAEEDSVALDQPRRSEVADRPLRVAVVRLAWIANFDDFAPLERYPGVVVDYVDRPDQLAGADLIVLPGSKSTVADLRFLAERGLAGTILQARANGAPILGICGGFQMLGQEIRDPDHVESDRDRTPGLGLLPHVTEFAAEKRTCRVEARVCDAIGPFQTAQGELVASYEIHQGRSFIPAPPIPAALFQIHARSGAPASDPDGAVSADGLVLGTYLHGLFENRALVHALVGWLRDRREHLDANPPGSGERGPGLEKARVGMAAEAGLISEFQPPVPTPAFQGQGSFHPRSGVEEDLADPDRAFDRWADVLEASLDLPRLFAACGLG